MYHRGSNRSLRHVGFEDASATGYSSTRDVNGIEWESFSAKEQDERVVAAHGEAVYAPAGAGISRN